MDKDTKTKYSMSVVSFFIGIFYILEGTGITQFGEKTKGTPDFMITLVGVIFFLASVMILVGKNARLNNFLASVLISIMGLMFGWISLYGHESNFSGNDFFISFITQLPIDRIMFGLGSILCFIVSIIAFRMFLKPEQTERLKGSE